MRMAKTQKATLDPSKISGRCGRLMCCLRYEDIGYEELRKKLPRKNTWVQTGTGVIGKVIDSQIITQLVRLLLMDNTQVVVPNEEIQTRAICRRHRCPRSRSGSCASGRKKARRGCCGMSSPTRPHRPHRRRWRPTGKPPARATNCPVARRWATLQRWPTPGRCQVGPKTRTSAAKAMTWRRHRDCSTSNPCRPCNRATAPKLPAPISPAEGSGDSTTAETRISLAGSRTSGRADKTKAPGRRARAAAGNKAVNSLRTAGGKGKAADDDDDGAAADAAAIGATIKAADSTRKASDNRAKGPLRPRSLEMFPRRAALLPRLRRRKSARPCRITQAGDNEA